MASIYIHVPFCKKKCLYCDFYSIGTSNKISQYPLLIEKELSLRKSFIKNEPIDTIYFGGGTPSLIGSSQINHILDCIAKTYTISVDAEITIEANPDDISAELLQGYRLSGVNRISIGIQSFIDDELRFLGRRHNAQAAEQSVNLAQKNGFENISIDLIYGLPNSSSDSWGYSLNKAFSLNIKHLSCYHLTYEEGTVFGRRLKGKKIQEVDESISTQQFDLLRELSKKNGFIHYEISNLAMEGYLSRHNCAYWQGIPYLGLGPAAHSYNGLVREWNPNSYNEWEQGIQSENTVLQSEVLDERTKFNEKLLTHLRTIWGVKISDLQNEFREVLVNQMLFCAKPLLKTGRLTLINGYLSVPPEHFFTSDGTIGNLILVED
ncbi:MAG: radical SAM family heme chaperone HemW [Bacteroidales bacterium]|nr:MAG: radical SAM family heme chaperone HemW [Bacteroidales bacterium]